MKCCCPSRAAQLIDGLFAVSARNAVDAVVDDARGGRSYVALTDQPLHTANSRSCSCCSLPPRCSPRWGSSLRISVWPSQAKRLLVMMISLVVLLPPMFTCVTVQDSAYDWAFVGLAVVLVAIGLWALRQPGGRGSISNSCNKHDPDRSSQRKHDAMRCSMKRTTLLLAASFGP